MHAVCTAAANNFFAVTWQLHILLHQLCFGCGSCALQDGFHYERFSFDAFFWFSFLRFRRGIQALNILAAKKSAFIQQTNDENAVPAHYAASVKQEAKIPVDQFKAFTVFEEERPPTDENVPPQKDAVSDEVDCPAMAASYMTVRYLHQTTNCIPFDDLFICAPAIFRSRTFLLHFLCEFFLLVSSRNNLISFFILCRMR